MVTTTTAPSAVVVFLPQRNSAVATVEGVDVLTHRTQAVVKKLCVGDFFLDKCQKILYNIITMEKKLMRVNEATEIFGCTRQNLYRLIKEKKLKTYKRYGLTLVDSNEVEHLSYEIKPRGMPRKLYEKL